MRQKKRSQRLASNTLKSEPNTHETSNGFCCLCLPVRNMIQSPTYVRFASFNETIIHSSVSFKRPIRNRHAVWKKIGRRKTFAWDLVYKWHQINVIYVFSPLQFLAKWRFLRLVAFINNCLLSCSASATQRCCSHSRPVTHNNSLKFDNCRCF